MRIKAWLVELFGALVALALLVTVGPILWACRIVYEEILRREKA